MYTLRTVYYNEKGLPDVQTNQYLGEFYQNIHRNNATETFDRIVKDFGYEDEKENIHGFVIGEGGKVHVALYNKRRGQKVQYFIVMSNGATYERLF